MPKDRKNILVCGGAGYIGSHVVRVLLEYGYKLFIVDDLSTGHLESVPENVEFNNFSIGNRENLSKVFKDNKIDAVVHLCANAYVGESVKNPLKYYSNNIANGIVLLETMLEHDVSKIVFSSSCAVYGHPDYLPIDENCSVAPISPYGHTKAMFEQIMADLDSAGKLRYCALRYFNAAGALDTGTIGEDHDPETHIIPLVLRQALIQKFPELKQKSPGSLTVFGGDYNTLDGTCIRDYIHVMDLAVAHSLALEYLFEDKPSTVCNLANARGFSVLEIIKVCEGISGHKIPFEIKKRRPGDPKELIGSFSKANDVLGWEPVHSSIDYIIRTAWKWHYLFPKGYMR